MIERKYPTSIHLDTYSYCNASCVFCLYPKMKREKGSMEFNLLEKIIDEVKDWKELKEIVPIHYGEFFLNPQWREILKLIEDKLPFVGIVLPTNMSKINYEIIDEVSQIQNLKAINFSINAFWIETRKNIMELDSLEWEKIMLYNSIFKKRGVSFIISMISDSRFHSELERRLFVNWAREHNIAYNIVYPATKYDEIYYSHGRNNKNFPCPTIYQDIVILWDGKIVPCCYDVEGEYVLGNAKEGKILDIWHGKMITFLRQEHLIKNRENIALCSLCNFS